MASMAVYLRSRPRSFLRAIAPAYSSSSRSLLSSSSSSSDSRDGNAQDVDNTESNPRPSLNDVKSFLKGRPQQPPRQGFSFSQGARPQQIKLSSVAMEEIQKSLSRYSQESVTPSGPSGVQDSDGQPPLLLQNLYKKQSENAGQTTGTIDKNTSSRAMIENIRQSLHQHKNSGTKRLPASPYSLSKYKETLNSKPIEGSNATGSRLIGGMSDGLPYTVFGKELREKSKNVEDENELVKDYSKKELGEELKKLRPEGLKQGQDWFSFSELNERLIKLREVEQQEEKLQQRSGIVELKKTLRELQMSEDNQKKNSWHRVGILCQGGTTANYMLAPPKENLVEKYFHPDNMSSAEKLKLELKRVRDEFKISETDCGSTRVQIAQLTTEISHLSKVLHKKDKHSKKGLLAKVQLRKKLLKYLRRTDWDSYCFILSKLGLRDNPGYKH